MWQQYEPSMGLTICSFSGMRNDKPDKREKSDMLLPLPVDIRDSGVWPPVGVDEPWLLQRKVQISLFR